MFRPQEGQEPHAAGSPQGKDGSFYLYTALDNDSKLIVTHLVDKRTDHTTCRFVSDLESRIVFAPADSGSNRPQINTDGWPSYQSTIKRSFGKSATHGVLVKKYVDPEVGRYSPPELRGTDRFSSSELMAFLAFRTMKIAMNHFHNPMCDLWKMVPAVAEKR